MQRRKDTVNVCELPKDIADADPRLPGLRESKSVHPCSGTQNDHLNGGTYAVCDALWTVMLPGNKSVSSSRGFPTSCSNDRGT